MKSTELFLLAGSLILVVAVAFVVLAVGHWLFGADGPLGSGATIDRRLRQERNERALARRKSSARHAALNANDDELRDLWNPTEEKRR